MEANTVFLFFLASAVFGSLTFTQARPCRVTWDDLHKGSSVDCSKRNLKEVPSGLPGDTTTLDLQGNDLGVLKSFTFIPIPKLVILNLANCNITGISETAFERLSNLQVLKLNHNRLLLSNDTYQRDVFRPLGKLKDLDLHHNDPRLIGTYPDIIFTPLVHLERLAIDTFKDGTFGKGFRYLQNLKELDFSSLSEEDSGYFCGLRQLKNDTFTAFKNSSTTTLNLENCKLDDIEPGVFLALSNIKNINLKSVMHITIERALKSMYGLNGKNVSSVYLSWGFHPKHVQPQDISKQVVTKQTVSTLTDICVLRLDLSHNILLYIDVDFINTFKKCLKYIDLSHNRLLGDVMILPYVSLFIHLEYFDISYQMTSGGSANGQKYHTYQNENSNSSVSYFIDQSNGVHFPLPPRLAELKVRSIADNFGDFAVTKIQGNKYLNCIDLADNGIRKMVNYITGIETVRVIKFSRNNGSGMTGRFLRSFAGVTNLSLVNMNFDENALIHGGPVFNGIQSLTNIQFLDLSYNRIHFLSGDFFKPLKNITTLKLTNNGFISLPLDLTFTSQLKHLDLAFNSITYLQNKVMDNLDVLARRHNVFLRLYGNPISCSCQSLSFITWLVTTRVTLDMEGNYSCMTEHSLLTTTKAVNEMFDVHWASCQSRFWFPFSVLLICLFAVITVSLVLVNRNWTRIQHRIMVLIGKGVKRTTREDFQKDAYIAHCDSLHVSNFVSGDLRLALEEQLNLRLVLPDRDFRLGSYIADNVVESVNSCWKTVIVVTQEFLENPWSYFIMKTVSYAVTDTNPNRVIVLLLGQVNQGQVPQTLLNVIEEEDIFQLDYIPEAQDPVWSSLRNRILKTYP